MPHRMVETPHSVDFQFNGGISTHVELLLCRNQDAKGGFRLMQLVAGTLPAFMRLNPRVTQVCLGVRDLHGLCMELHGSSLAYLKSVRECVTFIGLCMESRLCQHEEAKGSFRLGHLVIEKTCSRRIQRKSITCGQTPQNGSLGLLHSIAGNECMLCPTQLRPNCKSCCPREVAAAPEWG